MKTIKNKNKNGRPKKETAEKKGYKISLKMASEEYYSLKAKARLASITRSEYIRRCILSSEVKQRLSSEHLGHIRQLSGMANNVNQIARKANTAGYMETHRECMAMVTDLDTVIKQIEDGR
jgi:hypothetical protein